MYMQYDYNKDTSYLFLLHLASCEGALLNHFAIEAFCTSRNNELIQLIVP